VAKPVASAHEVPTEFGPARLHVSDPGKAPVGRIALGHGFGGGVNAPDLVAVFGAATAAGWQVVLIEQPYRVAGKKAGPRTPALDAGWLAAMAGLDALAKDGSIRRLVRGRPLVTGGRSAGARTACRTADQLGVTGICCLAFPLHPPGRPESSRAEELLAPAAPALVVQGETDPFGRPGEFHALPLPARVELVAVPGDHGLSRPVTTVRAVAEQVTGWLERLRQK